LAFRVGNAEHFVVCLHCAPAGRLCMPMRRTRSARGSPSSRRSLAGAAPRRRRIRSDDVRTNSPRLSAPSSTFSQAHVNVTTCGGGH
jgi:hypothetical protein